MPTDKPRRMIPVEEVFPEWRLDPEYVMAYADLKDEFDDALTRSFHELVRQLIKKDPEFTEALLVECWWWAEAALKAHRENKK